MFFGRLDNRGLRLCLRRLSLNRRASLVAQVVKGFFGNHVGNLFVTPTQVLEFLFHARRYTVRACAVRTLLLNRVCKFGVIGMCGLVGGIAKTLRLILAQGRVMVLKLLQYLAKFFLHRLFARHIAAFERIANRCVHRLVQVFENRARGIRTQTLSVQRHFHLAQEIGILHERLHFDGVEQVMDVLVNLFARETRLNRPVNQVGQTRVDHFQIAFQSGRHPRKPSTALPIQRTRRVKTTPICQLTVGVFHVLHEREHFGNLFGDGRAHCGCRALATFDHFHLGHGVHFFERVPSERLVGFRYLFPIRKRVDAVQRNVGFVVDAVANPRAGIQADIQRPFPRLERIEHALDSARVGDAERLLNAGRHMVAPLHPQIILGRRVQHFVKVLAVPAFTQALIHALEHFGGVLGQRLALLDGGAYGVGLFYRQLVRGLIVKVTCDLNGGHCIF